MTVARAIELFRLFLLASRAKQKAIERILKGADEQVAEQAGGTGVESVLVRGNLRYRLGFEDVWVGGVHYNLQERAKARLCVQYLVEMKAFDEESARHFVDEIDPYVRAKGDFPRLADTRLVDYFSDRTGKLRQLRRSLIAPAGRSGRYFLRVN